MTVRPDVAVATGLSSAEVAARVAAGEVNVVQDATSRSLWEIVRGNLFTLFNAILGIALVVVLAVGAWRDAVFGLVLVSNTLIGALTEYRAKRTLDRLAILDAAQVVVVRDGANHRVPTDQVVLGDVLRLTLGDQVPADAEVLASEGLEVDESMLTGESEPVDKAAGDTVLSGSAVVAGGATVRTTRVGADAYAQRLTAQARRFSLVGSELRAGINRVLVVISWVIVPIALLLFWSQIRNVGGWQIAFAGDGWREAVVQAVAGIVGMVPEGLVLLTSINFALAAVILARRRVLVQELPAVEVLARVDVLCLDKTGTITDGTVALDELVELRPVPGARELLATIARDPQASATAAAMVPGLDGVVAAPMQVAVPFSSARKWSGHVTDAGTWVFGAPEVVLGARDPGDAVLARVRELAAGGARVLLLARAPGGVLSGDDVPPDVDPVMLAVLRENVRPDAAQTLAYFAEQGVEVKIVSGDNPATVASIARAVGLGGGGPVAGVDARTLPSGREALRGPVSQGRVFGRVTPEQKRAFVQALQDEGRTAAMTGDGVNDALALKDADLGIAMGNGAAATKAVARLVLLDGRFATLPGVVAQGRRVIANMERVASLFLTKTTYAVMLAVVVAVVAWPYPFLPRQLTLVGALTIGTPAFFLALAPNDQRYRRGFLERVLQLSVPCGLICGTGVLAVYGTLYLRGESLQASTASTLTLIVMALWLLGILARPWNWWRVLLVAAMALGAVLAVAVPFVREFFALEWPEASTWRLVLVVGALGAALIEGVHRLRDARLRRAAGASGAVPGSLGPSTATADVADVAAQGEAIDRAPTDEGAAGDGPTADGALAVPVFDPGAADVADVAAQGKVVDRAPTDEGAVGDGPADDGALAVAVVDAGGEDVADVAAQGEAVDGEPTDEGPASAEAPADAEEAADDRPGDDGDLALSVTDASGQAVAVDGEPTAEGPASAEAPTDGEEAADDRPGDDGDLGLPVTDASGHAVAVDGEPTAEVAAGAEEPADAEEAADDRLGDDGDLAPLVTDASGHAVAVDGEPTAEVAAGAEEPADAEEAADDRPGDDGDLAPLVTDASGETVAMPDVAADDETIADGAPPASRIGSEPARDGALGQSTTGAAARAAGDGSAPNRKTTTDEPTGHDATVDSDDGGGVTSAEVRTGDEPEAAVTSPEPSDEIADGMQGAVAARTNRGRSGSRRRR